MPIPNQELTTTRKLLLGEWQRHVERFGAPPSYRWLAAQLKINYSAVGFHVRKLREQGFLREQKITATRLALSAKGKKAVGG